MNTNFKVIGLTRLGIKTGSTAPGSDTLATRPSEQLIQKQGLFVNYEKENSKRHGVKPKKKQPSGSRFKFNFDLDRTNPMRHKLCTVHQYHTRLFQNPNNYNLIKTSKKNFCILTTIYQGSW